MGRLRRSLLLLAILALSARLCFADSYDPPTHYYDPAIGTGAALTSQLHAIISPSVSNPLPVTARNYDSARSSLQLTDADPNIPGNMLTVYDRASIDLAAIVSDTNPPI
jgi:hypothetical protein